MKFSSSIHLPANNIILFFFYGWIILHCVLYHIFLIHSLVLGNPDCFQSLDTVNSAAMNMALQVALWKGNFFKSFFLHFIYLFIYFFIIHMCIQGLGHFSPLPPPPPLPPTPSPSSPHHPLNTQQKLFCPYF
jgi:hypothetical protein